MSAKKIATFTAIALLLGIGGFVGVSTLRNANNEIPAAVPRVDYADLIADQESEGSPEDVSNKSAQESQSVTDSVDASGEEDIDNGETAAAQAASPAERTSERGLIEDPDLYASVSGIVQDLKGNPIVGASVIISASGFEEKDLRGDGFREFEDVVDAQLQ